MRSACHSIAATVVALCVTQSAGADEWCTVTGVGVSENAGTTTIHGTLSGTSGTAYKSWLVLDRTESAEIVKKRTALALAAMMAGKDLQIYVTGGYTCVNMPSWQPNLILHLQVQ